ncbi:hypothetical protein G9C98_000157 [Cotesia typhae]|uniref:Kinesin-like protein n=1 Tax=Cotesia typhae TaxID=2053667 RepID=A0A8J5V1I2_9HYME|nr:hypothetical protein G9C98_000157 [Cotesia typhae]
MNMTQFGSSGSGGSGSSSSGSTRNFKDRVERRSVPEKLVVNKQKRASPKQYLYDLVLGEDSSQEAVYEGTTKSLVQDIIDGYNATVFAYGATGAGKTHTMVGSAEEPGVMVIMSYLEIYNENIRDLLNPNTGYLELRDDSRGRNIQITGLTEVSINSTEEVMKLLHQGNKARTVEPTAANETSSRSHALLNVVVKQTTRPSSGRDLRHRARVKQGKLFMIDLAGSERAKQTKNQGKRLQEGAHINRSLLALGNCITALSGGARYVNYRDSKLTRLLKDALGGNCRTVMIAHVSPSGIHREESKNTLMYADRANRITTKAEQNIVDVNYHVSQYRDIISDLKNEISRLRNKMHDTERPDIGRPQTQERISTTKVNDLRSLHSHLLGLNIAAEQQHAIISHWESRNNKLYKASKENTRRRSSADSQIDETESEDLGEEYEINDITVQQAWTELSEINKEQERYIEIRAITERELENCRQRSASLENELPARINSEEERELLALMLRVHELEADKMMLQSERLVKQHELRRRELLLLSSTDSDWESPLPPIPEPQEIENVMGPVVRPLISPSVFFPPISNSKRKNQENKLRRVASDNNVNSPKSLRDSRLKG